MKKDKIIVWGYWAGNLGDDLFLYILCRRYPKACFIITCDEKYTGAFKKIDNLIIVKDMDIIKNEIYLQIFLGGSLFMQPKDKRQIETKFLDTTKKSLLNVPYVVIGANFGPYKQRKHLILYKDWFQEAEDVCFRDSWSRLQFHSSKNIRWAPDIILGQCDLFNNLSISSQEKIISISIIKDTKRIGLPNYSEKNYIRLLIQTIQRYIENDYKIQLLSFCPKQGDTLIAKEILEMITPAYRDKIRIIEYTGYIEDFIEKSYNCEYIIGTRFHSVIIAWGLGKRVLPIIYNDKMKHILKDYNFPYSYINITNLEQVTFEIIDENRLLSPWECERLKTESIRQFNYLDYLLGDSK